MKNIRTLFKRRSLSNQEGFSLLEIIIVIAIIGTLMGIIVSRLSGGSDNAKVGITDTKAFTLQSKLIQYQLAHDNKFPTTAQGLQALTTTSGGVAIASDDDLKDGFGNAFDYKLTPQGPLIISNGSSGQPSGTTTLCYINGKKMSSCADAGGNTAN